MCRFFFRKRSLLVRCDLKVLSRLKVSSSLDHWDLVSFRTYIGAFCHQKSDIIIRIWILPFWLQSQPVKKFLKVVPFFIDNTHHSWSLSFLFLVLCPFSPLPNHQLWHHYYSSMMPCCTANCQTIGLEYNNWITGNRGTTKETWAFIDKLQYSWFWIILLAKQFAVIS